MTKKEEPKKSFGERLRSLWKKVLVATIFAVVAFLGIDGYLNEWALLNKLLHGGELALNDGQGDSWILEAPSDFELIPVDNVSAIATPDSLMAFDQRYREAGYYRLYFRLSDSLSAKLKRLSDAAAKVDTGRMIERSITDAQTAYGVFRRLVGLDTTSVADSARTVVKDTTVRKVESGMAMGTEQALSKVATQILKQPQVIAGLGVGLAAAASMELMQSECYVAVSKKDVFRVGTVLADSRTGFWEGRPIDILWIFAKEDTTRRFWLEPAPVDSVQLDSVATTVQSSDSVQLMEE